MSNISNRNPNASPTLPDVSLRLDDDGSIDVDLSELNEELETTEQASIRKETLAMKPLASQVAGTVSDELKKPMLDRLHLLAAGQVLDKLPNIELVETLKVDGIVIKDFQKALTKFRNSIDKELRSTAGKMFDGAVYTLGGKDTRTPEEKAFDATIDEEVLKMKPAPTRAIKGLISAIKGKEKTEEEKKLEAEVLPMKHWTIRSFKFATGLPGRFNTWFSGTGVGKWFQRQAKNNGMQETYKIEITLKNGNRVRFEEDVEDAETKLMLQRVALGVTTLSMTPVVPFVCQATTVPTALAAWLTAGVLGIKVGLAHLGVGNLEDSGGVPLMKALNELALQQLLVAIPYAPPMFPLMALNGTKDEVIRLSGEDVAAAKAKQDLDDQIKNLMDSLKAKG